MDSKKNSKIKFFAVSVFFFFLMTSAAQAIVLNNTQNDRTKNIFITQDGDYYTWVDNFDNAQKIDPSLSENYIVDNSVGEVKMVSTFPQWDDSDWTRMKVITMDSTDALEDCAIKLIVESDTDMRSDYGDLRFKFNDEDWWLDYWIEEINPEPNNPYAIVWIEIDYLPSGENFVYMFYGNPSATDQSDYWSVFDKDSWQKEHVHDHRITNHWYKEGAWDPDVCWGDNEFLVTWEEGTAYWPKEFTTFQQQIRACYYDKDGNPTSARFDIVDEPDETVPYRYENPSGCYGKNGKYFVAYNRYTNWNAIQGKFLNIDVEGAIVDVAQDGVSTRFTISDAAYYQADPCVTWDPNYNNGEGRFLVVWEDAREGYSNYNVYGRFYDYNGDAMGDSFAICTDPNSQVEPWVCFDSVNNHYMVVWEEGLDPKDGPFDIHCQLLDETGGLLGGDKMLSLPSSEDTDYNFPCVAFCPLTERYFITWQEDDISDQDWYGDIWGIILDEDGDTTVDIFQVAYGNFERTNIVQHLSSSFFVVYDGGGDIWGKLVSSEGDINPYTLQLSDGESSPADWANIASSGEKIFVVWEDTRVEYQSPFNGMPDVYSNVWSFNTPSSSDVSVDFGEEESLVLNAHITSKPIAPINLENWHQFAAIKEGDVTFDILDANTLDVIKEDISSGTSIEDITQDSIRLKASFSRDNPSSTPTLDKWSLSYVGLDELPPSSSISNIDGIKGLNEWYISEGVKLWISAEDFPEDTGSGIDKIYYTLNSGSPQEYIPETGLILSVSQASSWWGSWNVNFWAVDNKGNEEDKTKPQNSINIKIDADKPFVNITSPADEQQVETPFIVRAAPSDNVGIDHVEFDIEPFGEREGAPYPSDGYDPVTGEYWWECDVEQKDNSRNKARGFLLLSDETEDDIETLETGVSVMVRAQVYDESGQTWKHQVWVHITNWENTIDYNEGETSTMEKLRATIFYELLNNFLSRYPLLRAIILNTL